MHGEDKVGRYVVIAHRRFNPAHREELERIFHDVVKHDERDEPETLVQTFQFEEPDWMWSYEVYTSREAYEAHVRWHDAEPWYQRIQEIFGEYEPTPQSEESYFPGRQRMLLSGTRTICTPLVGKGIRLAPPTK